MIGVRAPGQQPVHGALVAGAGGRPDWGIACGEHSNRIDTGSPLHYFDLGDPVRQVVIGVQVEGKAKAPRDVALVMGSWRWVGELLAT